MRPHLTTTTTLALLLLAGTTARAEIRVGFTAEWLAHASDLIATATPLEVRTTKGPGDVWFTQVRYRLDRVVKGPATPGDALTVYDYSYGAADPLDLAAAVAARRQVLVFAGVGKDLFPEVDGKFVVTGQAAPRTVFYLDRPVAGVYTPEARRVTRADEVTDRAAEQVRRERAFRRQFPQGRVGTEWVAVPDESDAMRDLYARSAVYVWQPAYRKAATEQDGTGGPPPFNGNRPATRKSAD